MVFFAETVVLLLSGYLCFGSQKKTTETGLTMPHNLGIILCALVKLGMWVTA